MNENLVSMLNFSSLRHKEDNRANRRKVSVIRKEVMTVMTSENIQVGDILYLTEDQEVPCDVIVLSSSHEQVCFRRHDFVNQH